MKKVVLSFTMFLLLACNQTVQKEIATGVAFDEEAEKAAIMKTIENETSAFYKRDYEGWKQNFIQKDYAFQGWSNGDGTFDASVGWQAIDKRIGEYIKNNPVKDGGSSHPRVERRNMLVTFFTDTLAFLVWDQYNADEENKFFTLSKDQRIMEKENGQWKIANVSSFWDYKNKIAIDSLQ
jgi:hypothetical protein